MSWPDIEVLVRNMDKYTVADFNTDFKTDFNTDLFNIFKVLGNERLLLCWESADRTN